MAFDKRTFRARMLGLGAFIGLLTATPALAQDFCLQHRGDVLGDPIEFSFRWPLEQETLPELLKRPDAMANILGLTSPAPFVGGGEGCVIDSIVGGLNCVETSIRNAGSGAGAATSEAPVDFMSPLLPSGEAAASGQGEEAAPETDRYAFATVTVRPVIDGGHPPGVRLALVDTTLKADLAKTSPEAAKRIKDDMAKMAGLLEGWSTTLGPEEVAELGEGQSWPSLELEALGETKLSQGARFSRSADISVPKACKSLLLMRAEAGRRGEELRKARKRLAVLRERRKNEKDSDRQRKLDVQIKIAENKVRKLAQPLADLEKRIRAERVAQDKARHTAEVAAIKADPKLTEAAKKVRLAEAARAMRAVRQYEKQRAAGLEAYRQGLANYDEKIANAPDAETRRGHEEAKERYQRLYEDWDEMSRRTLATRYRDMNRAFKENAEDELGPTNMQSVHSQLAEAGVDPAAAIERSEEGMLERAARIAKSDERTLGGQASRANDLMQGYKDTAIAFAEERDKVILSPMDAVRKIEQIANGETTLEQVLKDQKQFGERFGRYAKGAAVGAGKGLVGLGELGLDGLGYIAEQNEAATEHVLSQLTGEDVQIDYYGDKRTKKLARALVGAEQALEGLWDRAGTRSGVPGGVSLKEAWDDPSKVGQFLVDAADDFSRRSAAMQDEIGGAVSGIADRKLATITKGGEKALRAALEKTGEVVGEASDLGLAALTAARGLKRGAKVVEEGLDAAGDMAGAARAADRGADVSKPARAAKGPADEVANLDGLGGRTELMPPDAPPLQPKPAAKPNAIPDDALGTAKLDPPSGRTELMPPDAPPLQPKPAAAPAANPNAIPDDALGTAKLDPPSGRTELMPKDAPPLQPKPAAKPAAKPNAIPDDALGTAKLDPPSGRTELMPKDAPPLQPKPAAKPAAKPNAIPDDAIGTAKLDPPSGRTELMPKDAPPLQPKPVAKPAANPNAIPDDALGTAKLDPPSGRTELMPKDAPPLQPKPAAKPAAKPNAIPDDALGTAKLDPPSGRTELMPKDAPPLQPKPVAKPAANPNAIPDDALGTAKLDPPSGRTELMPKDAPPLQPKPKAVGDAAPGAAQPDAMSKTAILPDGGRNAVPDSAPGFGAEPAPGFGARPAPGFGAEPSPGFGAKPAPDFAANPAPKPRPDAPKPERSASAGSEVPESKRFEISPELRKMLEREAPPELTSAQVRPAKDSPYADPMLPTRAEAAARRGVARTPDGKPAKMPSREDAAGLDLELVRPDGSVETIPVGEKLGSGAASTAYKLRGGDEAVRITAIDPKQAAVFRSELAARRVVQEAEAKATYFRSAKREGAFGISEIDGKHYLVTREELLTDAQKAFNNPNNPNPLQGAPNASALDRLTMELAIRDLNRQGVAFTDHKLANIAVVKDPTSPTGRRVVFFDTGGIMPMKGAKADDMARNARAVQREFDRPSKPGLSSDEVKRYNQLTFENSKVWERVDKRPFGDKFPAGLASPGGNRHRAEYFKMSAMNAEELSAYIRNSPDIQRQLAAEGRKVEDIVVPDIPL